MAARAGVMRRAGAPQERTLGKNRQTFLRPNDLRCAPAVSLSVCLGLGHAHLVQLDNILHHNKQLSLGGIPDTCRLSSSLLHICAFLLLVLDILLFGHLRKTV